MIKNIIQGVAVSIIVGLLSWIAVNTMGYKTLKETVKTHTEDEWNRYVELNTKVCNLKYSIDRQRLIDSIKQAK